METNLQKVKKKKRSRRISSPRVKLSIRTPFQLEVSLWFTVFRARSFEGQDDNVIRGKRRVTRGSLSQIKLDREFAVGRLMRSQRVETFPIRRITGLTISPLKLCWKYGTIKFAIRFLWSISGFTFQRLEIFEESAKEIHFEDYIEEKSGVNEARESSIKTDEDDRLRYQCDRLHLCHIVR